MSSRRNDNTVSQQGHAVAPSREQDVYNPSDGSYQTSRTYRTDGGVKHQQAQVGADGAYHVREAEVMDDGSHRVRQQYENSTPNSYSHFESSQTTYRSG